MHGGKLYTIIYNKVILISKSELTVHTGVLGGHRPSCPPAQPPLVM